MDFELNEEQRILQKTARDFLKKECPKELVRQLNESDTGHSPELWQKMAELGWQGLILPEVYGGAGWSFLDMAVLLEEMGYNLCPGPFVSTAVLAAPLLVEAGTEAQKSEILPLVARGKQILTLAVLESDCGYDSSVVRTTAVREGDGWVLDGTKLFVPDALAADRILCVARTGGDPGEGLSLFLVDSRDEGVSVTPLKTISGERQCEVVLRKVRLGPERLAGPEGLAWPMVRSALDRAAVARAAETVGAMRATLDLTLAYAKERVQFGRPIGSFQAIQHYLADMWLDILGTRNLVLRAAWKISTGRPARNEVGMAKVRAGQLGRKVTTVGHRIFGAIGFTMEHDLHLYHRRTVGADVAFGDTDFHYEEVARGLGL
ncbi:MAG: acyl-CoA/acyl-ACP dehydrogenase [Deltaproteobacteria bacterium]|nr:acyl-CoA/acyl-ACP dehydrogenase [Deltaproteobacteria bacterium]MBW1923422.1 acyl-CoA/acyl-ACP dehydrogenase [Deltaproteobacteria bacterium]MBW1948834.1 acyl-CoA/acyl-ACP dehydrogenase [Deltaproteobacteria bacterium]MBW2008281.1 acyl-CoA/acyl-ACP dehydrogenase [Deltaproteobacteria bacterium]